MTERTSHVRAVFPEADAIDDASLRAGVLEAWTTAMDETDVEDLTTVPWYPPMQRRHDIADETLVDHVRDVTTIAVDVVETLTDRRGTDISMDTVLAGALVHDVSKLYEYDGFADTEVERLLGHPHYGVHVTAAAGLPVDIQHVVLAHSDLTAVDPATLPALVVKRADDVAAAAITTTAVADLRDV